MTTREHISDLSDLQIKKLERAFGQLDANGNDVLERDDFQAVGARLLLGFGEPPTTTKGRAVLDTFDGIWHTLRREMDTNGDGVLSRDEFRAGMDQSFIRGTEYDDVFQPAAEAVMAVCDTDGDGVLSFAEFHEFQRALGTTDSYSRAAFDSLDLDGDGTLNVEELLVAIRQFYTGSDPSAPGNQLYGPL